MRLIDADKLYDDIAQCRDDGMFGGGTLLADDILEDINLSPTVDAEPVVYCKDCAMSDVCLIESVLIRCGSDKPFCSIGEPKDGDKLCKQ